MITGTEQPLLLQNLSINHHHLMEVMSKIQEAIASPDTRQTALVIGPTGAGKTHLAKRLEAEFKKQFAEAMRADKQFLPVVRVSVPMVTDRSFSWKSYYDTFLRALGCPFRDYRSTGEAREKLVDVIKQRRVQMICLDELQHLLHVGNYSTLVRQSEVLKSLAEETGVKHIGYGTYDLLKMVRANGQLSRRTELIHFRRYDRSEEDYAFFITMLKVLDKQLAESLGISLVENADYIHRGCAGLTGILRDWIVRAWTNAQLANEPIITLTALQETELSVLDRNVILHEAAVGEASFTPNDADISLFNSLLDGHGLPISQEEPTTLQRNKPRGRIGIPLPKR